MSKRMVDLKVQDGKVASIDGYEVGGGSELSGDALMNITKDTTTITRTLDVDGKVKFDNVAGAGSTIRTTYTQDSFSWDKNNSDTTYQVGDILRTYIKQMDENELPLQIKTSAVVDLGTAKFIAFPVQWNVGSIERAQAVELVCIVPGTIPANYSKNFIQVNRVRVVTE